jgi:hypothetical protein
VLDDSHATTSKRRTFDHHYIGQSSTKGGVLGQVIHIQSPRPTRTYVQTGRSGKDKGKGRDEVLPLGIELPWVGIQIKRLGNRGIAVEFGVKDTRGIEGIIRLSSYKVCSTSPASDRQLKLQTTPTSLPHRSPPLIHLPLDLPKQDQHTLTSWLDIKLNLASLIPLFKTLPRPQADTDKTKRQKLTEPPLPSGSFGQVTYVRVYANCRLRRIWFVSPPSPLWWS